MGKSFSMRSDEGVEAPKRPSTPGWVWVLIVSVPLVLSAVVVALAVWLTTKTAPAPRAPATTLDDLRRTAERQRPAPPPPDPTPAPRTCALAPSQGLLVSGSDRGRRPSVAISGDRVTVAFVRYTQASQSCQRLESSVVDLPSPLPLALAPDVAPSAFDEGNGCTGVILHTPAVALVGNEAWAFGCRFPVQRGLECQIRRSASDIATWGLPQSRDTAGNTAVAVASAGNRIWIAQPADSRGIAIVTSSAAPGQRPDTPVFAVGGARPEGASLDAVNEGEAWLAWRDGGSVGAVRLGVDGRPLGAPRRIQSLSGRPTEPAIAATPTGAVLLYGDTTADGAGSLMVAQLPIEGDPTTPVALVPGLAGTSIARPRATLDAAGRLMVVWTERAGERGSVRGAVFRSDDLLPVIAPYAISSQTSDAGDADIAPGLTPLRAAVAWEGRTSAGAWGVRVARLLCAE